MITIGIEGPALTGKSTAIRQTLSKLAADGVSGVADVPCFVDWALATGQTLPALRPSTWQEQEAAVFYYLRMENRRLASAFPAKVVLMDRTCKTLIAHTAALMNLGLEGPAGGLERLETAASSMSSSSLVYLDTSQQILESRAAGRSGFPQLLIDPRFNTAFRDYFITCGEIDLVINGDRSVPSVCDALAEFVKALSIRNADEV